MSWGRPHNAPIVQQSKWENTCNICGHVSKYTRDIKKHIKIVHEKNLDYIYNLNQGPIHVVIELPHSPVFHHTTISKQIFPSLYNQTLLGLSLFLLILVIINNVQNKKKKAQPKKHLIIQRWKYLFTDSGIMEG